MKPRGKGPKATASEHRRRTEATASEHRRREAPRSGTSAEPSSDGAPRSGTSAEPSSDGAPSRRTAPSSDGAYWADRLRLIPDGEDEAVPVGPTEPDRRSDRPEAHGIPRRWCALVAVLALALAGAGGDLLNARRSRTVTNTVVGYQHPHGVGLTGCPREDVCQPLPEPYFGLTGLLPPELAGATLLAGNMMLDSSTSGKIRTLQILTADGLTLAVTGQCVAGAAAVPARDIEPTRAADGSTELGLVRPGRQPGCSVALIARVPAGLQVPTEPLRQLADELPQRLVD